MGKTSSNSKSQTAPGEQLREVRQSYKWSLEDVAANLNLTVDTVRALETGDYSSLPEATFIRGYLRAYARLMELDEDKIVLIMGDTKSDDIGSVVPVIGKEAFKERKDRQWLKFSTTSRTMGKGRVLLITCLIVIAILIAWWLSGVRPPVQKTEISNKSSTVTGEVTIPLGGQN